eukprot:GFYU01010045.1.p1 GENE.GFYU01010045.1~~GFYU01010045.1.p1  ORF type:complete len:762 (+),score=232.05 GFYU01010045.1:108-2288(+)
MYYTVLCLALVAAVTAGGQTRLSATTTPVGLLLSDTTVSPAGRTVSFQPHSVNALDQWSSLWRHDMRHAKLDPHFVEDVALCKAQVGDRHVIGDNGCFLLNHDGPVSQGRYNSTDDLLDYLSSDRVVPHLQRKDSRMMIALCFKDESINPCDGSDKSAKWTALLEDFFTRANQMIDSHSMNLEFILDGAGKPKDCTVDKWRPWNSTWIKTPAEALTSDDVSKGYDRYRVLNVGEDLTYWQNLATQKYGKFPSNTQYPMQLWEPSDEKEIEQYLDTYINSGVVHKPGFLFATNTNPTMFQLYSSTRTGLAMRSTVAFDFKAMESRIVVGRPAAGVMHSPLLVIAKVKSSNTHVAYLQTPGGKATDVFTLTLPSSWAAADVAVVDASQSASSTEGVTYTVATEDGRTALCTHLDDPSKHACVETESPIASQVQTSTTFTTTRPTQAGSNTGVVTVYTALCTGAHDGICPRDCSAVVHITDGADKSVQCVSTVADLVSVSSAGAWVKASDGSGQLRVVVVVGTSDKKLLISTVEYTHMDAVTVQPPAGASTVLVHAGENPHVSAVAAADNTAAVFLVVAESGYCFNSHKHNTQAYPTVCQAEGTATGGVLTYTFGTYAQLAAHVATQGSDGVTSCHPTLTHGAYDLGHTPATALFLVDPKDDTFGWPTQTVHLTSEGSVSEITLSMLELHRSPKWYVTLTAKACGVPDVSFTDASTFVTNSWRLPQCEV